MRTSILVALALCCLAERAHAQPRLVLTASSFRAGELVTIAWTDPGALVHEVELELSLAGGGWRRISPELDARQRGYRWRVPPALTGEARLRLRWGGAGFEAEGEPVAIRLESEPGGALPWTIEDRFEPSRSIPPADAFASGVPMFSAGAPRHAVATSSGGLRAPARAALALVTLSARSATGPGSTSRRATLTRALPLRI